MADLLRLADGYLLSCGLKAREDIVNRVLQRRYT